MSKPTPARYRTTNWPEYNAALRRRGSLLVWLDREMGWLAPASGRPGRPETFSDAAIQFCLSIKVLFGLALRQAIGMVASLLKMAGLDWPVHHGVGGHHHDDEHVGAADFLANFRGGRGERLGSVVECK